MSTSVFERFGACINKKSMCVWLVSVFLIALALPVWAGSKKKDEETLKNATNVLQKMLSDQNIPSDVIAKADCVVVLPNVKKIGFGIGGSGGRGKLPGRADGACAWIPDDGVPKERCGALAQCRPPRRHALSRRPGVARRIVDVVLVQRTVVILATQ